jgi:hypothetical protein
MSLDSAGHAEKFLAVYKPAIDEISHVRWDGRSDALSNIIYPAVLVRQYEALQAVGVIPGSKMANAMLMYPKNSMPI